MGMEKDLIDLVEAFHHCLKVIDLIKEYDLQSYDKENYRFSNMAFIVEKVFDDNLDAILAFADYIKEFAPQVMEETFGE